MTEQKSESSANGLNWLKVRDDREPLKLLKKEPGAAGQSLAFEVIGPTEDNKPSWAQGGSTTLADIRSRVEPWLVALFQSEHLSLLAGSGLTHAVHYMATGGPATSMGGSLGTGERQKLVDDSAAESARKAGRSEGNIEDKIRVANELLRGYEILNDKDNVKSLQEEISEVLKALSTGVLESERSIVEVKDETRQNDALDTLVSFLASFASRTGTRDRLHIFTTNYDRLIEEGAELAGIHLLDRFVGTLAPIFRASRLDLDMHYNPPGIRGEPRYLEGVVRFTKLHGSLDWMQVGRVIRRAGVPFGAEAIDPYLKAPGLDDETAHKLMIFPNAAKDWETAGFPYVELFRDFAAATCRPNSTLVTYGYGFGDDHINRVVEDMLTIPSTHVVIISRDDPMGRMRMLAEKRPAQVSLLIGPDLADIQRLTAHFLPKAAIDRATVRMSELLKDRYGAAGKRADAELSANEGLISAVPSQESGR